MNLSNFIRHNLEKILQEWQDQAYAVQPESGSMDKKELRDHAEKILLGIVDRIDRSKSKQFREEQSQGLHPLLGNALRPAVEHGNERHDFGFNMNDVLSEYRALRSSVMRLWAESTQEESDRNEIALFNEELDGVIKEAIEAFSAALDKVQEERNDLTELNKRLQSEISVRTDAEKALRESEKKYRLLVENQTELVVKVNAKRRFLYVNPSYCKMFGKNEEELLGQKFMPLVHEEDKAAAMESIKSIQYQPHTSYFEQRTMTKKGWLWLAWVQSAVLDDRGKIKEVIVAGRDITKQKRATEELEQSNGELRQFVRVASHDLQEPLRAIVGFLQLLQQNYSDKIDRKGQQYIDRTVAASHRIQNLVRDLLSLSRITNHSKFAPTDLNYLVKNVIQHFQPILQKSNAEVVCDYLPTLPVDTDQVQCLFKNLIENALKYNESKKPGIEIGCRPNNDNVHFFVRDNGIGISPQYHESIFGIFKRLHTAEKYQGTGLGLAMCRKIVEGHGGKIWVESQLGEGSTFHFSLPTEQ